MKDDPGLLSCGNGEIGVIYINYQKIERLLQKYKFF